MVGVDAGRVAAGAAGRNGGFLLGGPALFLPDAITRWGADAAVGLHRETLPELDRLEAALGASSPPGRLDPAGRPARGAAEGEERERELADVPVHPAALRTHGFAVEDYTGPLGTGIYLPDDAAMNPARRGLGLAAALSPSAALYEHTPVTRVAPSRVATGRGVISAEVVIVAVDGRLEVLLPQLAGRVRTARLQMLATSPAVAGRLPRLVYGRCGYDYAQQALDGRLSSAAAGTCSRRRSGRPTRRRPRRYRATLTAWRRGWPAVRSSPGNAALGGGGRLHARRPPAVRAGGRRRDRDRRLQRHWQPGRPGPPWPSSSTAHRPLSRLPAPSSPPRGNGDRS